MLQSIRTFAILLLLVQGSEKLQGQLLHQENVNVDRGKRGDNDSTAWPKALFSIAGKREEPQPSRKVESGEDHPLVNRMKSLSAKIDAKMQDILDPEELDAQFKKVKVEPSKKGVIDTNKFDPDNEGIPYWKDPLNKVENVLTKEARMAIKGQILQRPSEAILNPVMDNPKEHFRQKVVRNPSSTPAVLSDEQGNQMVHHVRGSDENEDQNDVGQIEVDSRGEVSPTFVTENFQPEKFAVIEEPTSYAKFAASEASASTSYTNEEPSSASDLYSNEEPVSASDIEDEYSLDTMDSEDDENSNYSNAVIETVDAPNNKIARMISHEQPKDTKVTINGWKGNGAHDQPCSGNDVMVGLSSEYNGIHKDRKWKKYCSKLLPGQMGHNCRDTKITPKSVDWNLADLKWINPETEYITGIKTSYDNSSPAAPDRRFKFYVCEWRSCTKYEPVISNSTAYDNNIGANLTFAPVGGFKPEPPKQVVKPPTRASTPVAPANSSPFRKTFHPRNFHYSERRRRRSSPKGRPRGLSGWKEESLGQTNPDRELNEDMIDATSLLELENSMPKNVRPTTVGQSYNHFINNIYSRYDPISFDRQFKIEYGTWRILTVTCNDLAGNWNPELCPNCKDGSAWTHPVRTRTKPVVKDVEVCMGRPANFCANIPVTEKCAMPDTFCKCTFGEWSAWGSCEQKRTLSGTSSFLENEIGNRDLISEIKDSSSEFFGGENKPRKKKRKSKKNGPDDSCGVGVRTRKKVVDKSKKYLKCNGDEVIETKECSLGLCLCPLLPDLVEDSNECYTPERWDEEQKKTKSKDAFSVYTVDESSASSFVVSSFDETANRAENGQMGPLLFIDSGLSFFQEIVYSLNDKDSGSRCFTVQKRQYDTANYKPVDMTGGTYHESRNAYKNITKDDLAAEPDAPEVPTQNNTVQQGLAEERDAAFSMLEKRLLRTQQKDSDTVSKPMQTATEKSFQKNAEQKTALNLGTDGKTPCQKLHSDKLIVKTPCKCPSKKEKKVIKTTVCGVLILLVVIGGVVGFYYATKEDQPTDEDLEDSDSFIPKGGTKTIAGGKKSMRPATPTDSGSD